jgi:hypothetical protein
VEHLDPEAEHELGEEGGEGRDGLIHGRRFRAGDVGGGSSLNVDDLRPSFIP